jgi:hypothetical protein
MSPPRTPKDNTPEKPDAPVETDQETTQPERFAAGILPGKETSNPSDKNN